MDVKLRSAAAVLQSWGWQSRKGKGVWFLSNWASWNCLLPDSLLCERNNSSIYLCHCWWFLCYMPPNAILVERACKAYHLWLLPPLLPLYYHLLVQTSLTVMEPCICGKQHTVPSAGLLFWETSFLVPTASPMAFCLQIGHCPGWVSYPLSSLS